MAERFASSTVYLTSAVASGGSIGIAYPSGVSPADFVGQQAAAGSCVIVDTNDRYSVAAGQIALFYGATSVTLVNLSGVTWPVGAKLTVKMDQREAPAAEELAAALILPYRSRNLWAALGDSLAAMLHLDVTGTFRNMNARHPLHWANGLSGGRGQFVSTNRGNFGVSGERTDQIMARVPAVIASGAGLVWLMAGTNDLAQNYPTAGTCAATAFANIATMVRRITAAGITVILELVVGATNLTAAQIGYMNELNQRLVEFATTMPNVYLHDASRMILDPTNSTSAIAFKTSYAYDATHPSALGGYYWGKSLATLIQQIVPPWPRLGHLNLTDAQRAPYIANGLFTVQTGGTNNIGAALTSGAVPTNWVLSRSGSPTVAISYDTDDGTALDPSMGSKCIMAVTFTAAGERISLACSDISTSLWNVGDIVDTGCRSRLVSGAAYAASVRHRVSLSVDGVAADYYSLIEASSTDPAPDEGYTVDQTLGPITAPTGTTKNFLSARTEVVSRAAGTVVVELSRFTMRPRLLG